VAITTKMLHKFHVMSKLTVGLQRDSKNFSPRFLWNFFREEFYSKILRIYCTMLKSTPRQNLRPGLNNGGA